MAIARLALVLEAAFALGANAATQNDIPGTDEVYTARETDARIASSAAASTNYADSVAAGRLPATYEQGLYSVKADVEFDGADLVTFFSGMEVFGTFSIYGGTRAFVSENATFEFESPESLSIGGTNIDRYVEAIAQVPGDYATVSNRAMTASNYTDAALGAFAATGSVARAFSYGTPTRWTDATGCVWEVGQALGGWTRTQGPSDVSVQWHDGDDEPPYTTEGAGWYFQGEYQWPQFVSSDETATALTAELQNTSHYGGGVVSAFAREMINETKLVGRVALTNDIPKSADLTPATNYANQVAVAATNYTDEVASEFADGTRTAANAQSAYSSFAAERMYDGDGGVHSYEDIMDDATNAATWAASSRVPKNALERQRFDFADMRGVYLSLSNVIIQLGGTVTNFPSFNQ